MQITVVGGSGFIGSRLCGRLSKALIDFKIVDLVKSGAFPDKWIAGDVTNTSSLMKVIDSESVIVNLAAEHRDDVSPKSLYHDVNVEGAKNICTVAREKDIKKIIFTSSVAVYGFAPLGTNEAGEINPFNDYGKTKYEAEKIFREWQAEDAENRSLVIVRPTVVFGERNRGNVYNLLKQIASGRFLMIGDGKNRKSMAYVENVAAFLEYGLTFGAGVHVFNYIDKPDFNMNELVENCRKNLDQGDGVGLRLPYLAGMFVGYGFDFLAKLSRKKLPISSIRVKKFCSNSVYNTAVDTTDFERPVPLEAALINTLRYEFLEDNSGESVFYTE